jgi:hypothetical protein
MTKTIYLIAGFLILLLFAQCKDEMPPGQNQTEPNVLEEDKPTLFEFSKFEISCVQETEFISVISLVQNTSALTEAGLVISEARQPTIEDGKEISGDLDNYHKLTVGGLKNNTKYFVRAYAINGAGISYSSEVEVLTYDKPLTLEIGDPFEGGIFLGFDCTGHHGVVMAERDLSGSHSWSSASDLAKSSELNGYTNWRLPTPYELLTAYNYLHLKGEGNFVSGSIYQRYWSDWDLVKNEGGVRYYQAKAQDFGDGQWYEIEQAYKIKVRLVRDF